MKFAASAILSLPCGVQNILAQVRVRFLTGNNYKILEENIVSVIQIIIITLVRILDCSIV